MPSPVMRVGGGRGVADEQRPAGRRARRRRCGRGWARPGAVPPARRRVRATARMCGRSGARATGPSCPCVAVGPPRRRAGCRSRRWPARRGAGTTRRSPGSRSGSNQHPQLARPRAGRRRRSTGGTRATRRGSRASPTPSSLRSGDHMPSAADRRSGRAPSPTPVDLEHDAVGALVGARAAAWPSSTSAPAARATSTQRRVELDAAGHRGERAPVRGAAGTRPRGPTASAPRTSSTGVPRRHGGRVEPEVLEQAQRAGGEPVAADLVAGERGLVDEHDIPPGAAPAGWPRPRRPGRRPPRRRRRPPRRRTTPASSVTCRAPRRAPAWDRSHAAGRRSAGRRRPRRGPLPGRRSVLRLTR